MNQSKPQSLVANNPSNQQSSCTEVLHLWQEYYQKLQSIAGTLSDSYWVSQLSMLKLDDQEPFQSKTKHALRLLNSHNSKLELITKIIKNLSLCSTIDYNQEKLVVQLIKLSSDWEKWVRSRVVQTYIDHDSFLGNDNHQNEDQTENMQTFEVDFDNRRLKEFEQGYNGDHEQKDIEI